MGNAKKSRGYTDEELAALRDAADRGALGNTLHIFGSRLVPYAAGVFGCHMAARLEWLSGAPSRRVSVVAR